MQTSPTMTRRSVLRGAGTLGVRLALSVAALVPPGMTPGASGRAQDAGALPIQPTLALSLIRLQQQVAVLQRAGRAIPDRLAQLGGVNRIQGVMSAPDGELILLGSRDAKAPRLDLESLVVALRNAYRVSPAYQGAPGCTIDPWTGEGDPWAIQRVTVTGMPPRLAMAARHVALDYELKKVSAGIVALGHGVTSLYELRRDTAPLCAAQQEHETAQTITHRFWFFPRYPPAPRFVQDAETVLILRPVEVQLLTEREFLDQAGRRQGAAPASPAAERFAGSITRLLATTARDDYTRLVQDFRLVEVAQLLRWRGLPAARLQYLLADYPLTEVSVPRFVGGIRREERGEMVCDTAISEQQLPQGTRVSSRQRVARYHYVSRGGVEARVRLRRAHFVPARAGALARLRQRVLASRPSPRAILWPISA